MQTGILSHYGLKEVPMKYKLLTIALIVLLALNCLSAFAFIDIEDLPLPEANPGELYEKGLGLWEGAVDWRDVTYTAPSWLDVSIGEDVIALSGMVPIDFTGGQVIFYYRGETKVLWMGSSFSGDLLPQVNAPDERIPLDPAKEDGLYFTVGRVTRLTTDGSFRLWEKDIVKADVSKKLIWRSKDSGIAEVDENGWVVTQGKTGKTEIWASYVDEQGVLHEANYTVSVLESEWSSGAAPRSSD